jgi:hypothetical protein
MVESLVRVLLCCEMPCVICRHREIAFSAGAN